MDKICPLTSHLAASLTWFNFQKANFLGHKKRYCGKAATLPKKLTVEPRQFEHA